MFLQNKTKKPEPKDPGGSQMLKDNTLTLDTGQSLTKEQIDPQDEPAAAAAASTFSPTTNNSNNYNLVSSLLNLTRSPVSETCEITFRFF